MEKKVLLENYLAPFSSDKIRAKILDLGYGGARNHEPESGSHHGARLGYGGPCRQEGVQNPEICVDVPGV